MATADDTYNAVWNLDKMKGPWMTPDNPTWTASSVLTNLYVNAARAVDASNAARTSAAAAKTDATAAKTGVDQLRTAVAALQTTLTATAADTAATRAAVQRIETALAGLQSSIAAMVADAVKAALAANTVAVDVTVSGNVPGTTPAVTLPR